MKLLIMQFSPSCCNLIPITYKYSPWHPVLKHLLVLKLVVCILLHVLLVCSCFNGRSQVSLPFKTTEKHKKKLFPHLLLN
jgi:hypothetical protein